MGIAERIERALPGQQGSSTEPVDATEHWNWRGYLVILSGLLMLSHLYLIFMFAPTDSVIGYISRVFYSHVPITVMSFLAFFLVFVASTMYPVRRLCNMALKEPKSSITGLGPLMPRLVFRGYC